MPNTLLKGCVKKEFIPLLPGQLHLLVQGTLNLGPKDVDECLGDEIIGRLTQAFNDLRFTPTSAWTEDDYDPDDHATQYRLDDGFHPIYLGDGWEIHQRDGWGNGTEQVVPHLMELKQWGAPSLYFEMERA